MADEIQPVPGQQNGLIDDSMVEAPAVEDHVHQDHEAVGETTSAPPYVTEEDRETIAKTLVNFIQEFDIFSSLGDKAWDELADTVALPSETTARIREIVKTAPKIDTDSSKDYREWANTLTDSMENSTVRDTYTKTLDNPDAEWVQAPKAENYAYPLVAGIPNLRFNRGERVTGERAVMRIRALAGMGTTLNVPLWHSGFWVQIKAPGDGALLELQRRLVERKVTLGRQTHGLAFANTSSFIVQWLVDFIIDHIYDTSVKGENIEYRKLIVCLDLNSLVWGLACTIWPNGFQFTRSCITNIEKCNTVVKEKIALSKILWVNRKALTARQLTHMTNQGGSTMSVESVEQYRKEFAFSFERSVPYGQNNNIIFSYRIPNLEDYILSGTRWINNIANMIESTLTDSDDEGKRNYYINELGKSMTMRQYAHWVVAIDGDGVICDDRESIEQQLDALSSIDDIVSKYFDDVLKFIDDATIALVAIPSFECPNCRELQVGNTKNFPHLIPIDVVSTFFTLLVQRLQKIRLR